MIKQLISDVQKQIHSVFVGRAIVRPPFINEEELIDFTVKLTDIDKKTVARVLEAEFIFLKLKGVVGQEKIPHIEG